MKKHILGLIFLVISIGLEAQQFTVTDAGLVNVSRSSIAWADYDNDGDLDVLLTGDKGSGPYIASIYRNDAGTFTNINAGLTGIYNSAVAWGDYDGDGDYDILACGRNANNSKSYIYQNNNGSFTQKEIGLPAIGSDGAVSWGDYDNDGDLDILIAGSYSCKIFNNHEGVFTDINAGLPLVSNAWVDWGDFDNDGKLDIFIMGDLGGILISSIYKNNGNSFTEMLQAGIMPLIGGTASWTDFDNDNDLDVLINGFDEYLEPKTTIYSNLGGMQFMDILTGITNSSLGTVAWADYDNDGDADLLLTGQNLACGSMSSKVYRNDDDIEFTDINSNLDGAERGSSAWVDFDNDGDLDILITGTNGNGNASTRLYKNNNGTNTFSTNQAPEVPLFLSSNITEHKVTLSWSSATDDKTPIQSLTYNLRIGSAPGAQDILAPMSNLENGRRMLPQSGNASNNNSWYVFLPDGTYYWSVQTIDQSFTASPFATEQSFTILNVGMKELVKAETTIHPNPVSDRVIIEADGYFSYRIQNAEGKVIAASQKNSNNACLSTSNWISGLYTIIITSNTGIEVKKIVKK